MTPVFKNIQEQKKDSIPEKNIIKPNELEHNELHLFKVENYKCNHGCNHSFKTKKQMIIIRKKNLAKQIHQKIKL